MMARTKRNPAIRCEWTVDDDGIYNSSCGQIFVFTDDGPIENKFRYCPYCGHGMKAAPVHGSSAMRRVNA